MDLNRGQLIGNMTAAPELRQTTSGKSVCSFSVATNNSYKDASGQLVQQAEFHNVVAWGKLAEIINQYGTKGKKVYVEGRMQTRSWDDANGAKRYKTEIVADNIILLDKSGGGSGDFMGNVTEMSDQDDESPAPKKGKKTAQLEEEISIEDVPF